MTNARLSRLLLCTTLFGGVALAAGTAAATTLTCLDFTAPALGTNFFVGDVAPVANATLHFVKFKLPNGNFAFNGHATVVASNRAFGTPVKELEMANINTRVVPSPAATSASFLYADHGGNVNFEVNGDFYSVTDLIVLDGTAVGGCDITVTKINTTPAQHHGEVTITPQEGVSIDSFTVGGQEFWLDDVCFEN